MDLKSRIFTISTAALLTMSFTVGSFADSPKFTDLSDIKGKDKILELQDKGYVKGVGNDLFEPNKAITTAESIQLMVNAFEFNIDLVRFIKAPKATDYFTNADDDAWYADALIIASVNGLSFENDIELSHEMTREEFTFQLIKAMEQKGDLPMINIVPIEITDEDQMAIEYSGAIQRAIIYGVVELDSDGKFDPKTEISREEAAVQIYNALEYLKAHPAPVIEPEK
ncbi:S-layer homology domain-containing protein [Sporosalibacterium faouarense]|uniref:S-layer homology domain-containing protein n=1 Tax=Sporosalibacterium faouarense TaxID=516123 RepID=UPI00192A6D38|nr:S-layer homology domain-containing protein [Sporosalibacterium faouarense]